VASPWRTLRRRILTPGTAATSLAVRGFHEKSPAARELLETIGRTFLAGFGYAAQARRPVDAEEHLEKVPVQFRGFGYEGAAMAFAILDGLPFGGGRNVERFVAGRGGAHIYMVYVGVGWAMARLPRFRWHTLTVPDPLLRWLALDGYGFHQAYFHTQRYVHEQFHDDRFPWPADGPQWYASRAIDQGIGRALWFVGGTAVDVVTTTIERFPEHRRPDLYSGAGLAATYAGGVDDEELRAFWDRAGDHRPQVAQGSAFAASARVRAGLVVPHNELATRVFCGMTVAEAAAVTDRTRPDGQVPGALPAYEVWRRSTANELVSIGRC